MTTRDVSGVVLLPPSVLERVTAEARRALPAECCGALLGRFSVEGVVVDRVLPLPNEAPEPGRYLLGPESVRAAEAVATRTGLDVVGFYHSHPSGTPTPSPADLAAAWPWYTYLLVDGCTGAAAAWRLVEDRSAFEEQVILEGGAR